MVQGEMPSEDTLAQLRGVAGGDCAAGVASRKALTVDRHTGFAVLHGIACRMRQVGMEKLAIFLDNHFKERMFGVGISEGTDRAIPE